MSRRPDTRKPQGIAEALRSLPSVDAILRAFSAEATSYVNGSAPPPSRVSQAARTALENARSAVQAGADVLVVGSAIFDTPDCGATTAEFVRKIETLQASSPA